MKGRKGVQAVDTEEYKRQNRPSCGLEMAGPLFLGLDNTGDWRAEGDANPGV